MPEVDALTIRSLAEILKNPQALVPPVAVVPGLVWAERLTVLAAREKLGKSTVAAYAAARVTKGEPFAGAPTTGVTVLWLSAEEHEADIAQRAQDFATEPPNLYILTDRGEDGLITLQRAVAAVRPELVIVDSLEAWAEGAFKDANASAELGPVMTALRNVARAGPGILVLHHANKSDGSYRGSSAIGAGCDVLVEMFSDDVDEAARVFKPRGRIRGLQGFTLKLDGNTYRVHAGELSPDARILAHVAATPGISRTALRDKVGGGHRAVDRVIDALVGRGAMLDEVTEAGHHRYHPATQGAGLRQGLEACPEPASSTPHAGFREAGSPTLPLSEIPGGAGLGQARSVDAKVQPCQHPTPVEAWVNADGWMVCGVCHPRPGTVA